MERLEESERKLLQMEGDREETRAVENGFKVHPMPPARASAALLLPTWCYSPTPGLLCAPIPQIHIPYAVVVLFPYAAVVLSPYGAVAVSPYEAAASSATPYAAAATLLGSCTDAWMRGGR